MNRIEYTDDMYKQLSQERKRVGIGTKALLKLCDDIPEGLSEGKIQMLVLRRQVFFVETAVWDWLIGRYKSLPDAGQGNTKRKGWVIDKNDPNIIPIDEKMHSMLMREIERTGMGYVSILKDCNNVPDGLTKQKISNWIRKRGITYVEKDQWNWLMERYQSLSNAQFNIKVNSKAEPSP